MDRSGVVLSLKGKHAIVFNNLCDYEKIKRTKDMFEGQLVEYKSPKKTGLHRYIAIASGIAAILAITCLFYVGCLKYNEYRIFAYVTLDVNPSIEYAINGQNCVVSIRPLNPESKKVINLLNIKGKSINIAISDTISELERLKYIVPEKESVILLSASQISSAKDQNGERMQVDKIINSIQPAIKQMIKGKTTVRILCVSQDTWQKSLEADMSLGRYALYINAKKNGVSITPQYAKEAPLKVLIGYYGEQTKMVDDTNEGNGDKPVSDKGFIPGTDKRQLPDNTLMPSRTPEAGGSSKEQIPEKPAEFRPGSEEHLNGRLQPPDLHAHYRSDGGAGMSLPEPSSSEYKSKPERECLPKPAEGPGIKPPVPIQPPAKGKETVVQLLPEHLQPHRPGDGKGRPPEPDKKADPGTGAGIQLPPDPPNRPEDGKGRPPEPDKKADSGTGAGIQLPPDPPNRPGNGKGRPPEPDKKADPGTGAGIQLPPDPPNRPEDGKGRPPEPEKQSDSGTGAGIQLPPDPPNRPEDGKGRPPEPDKKADTGTGAGIQLPPDPPNRPEDGKGRLPEPEKQTDTGTGAGMQLPPHQIQLHRPEDGEGVKPPEPEKQTEPGKGAGVQLPPHQIQLHRPEDGEGVKPPESEKQTEPGKGAGVQLPPHQIQLHRPEDGEGVQPPESEKQTEPGKGAGIQLPPDQLQPHRPEDGEGVKPPEPDKQADPGTGAGIQLPLHQIQLDRPEDGRAIKQPEPDKQAGPSK